MSADIVSFEDWRETRNSKAATVRWAMRLRTRMRESEARATAQEATRLPAGAHGDDAA